MLVHIERQNWDALRVELQRLGVDEAKQDTPPGELVREAQGLIGGSQRAVIKAHAVAAASAPNLFARALQRHRAPTEAFVREYQTSKRLHSLWHQARKARNDFLTWAPALIPLLQVKHWKMPPAAIADCILLNKQFEPLKQLYIDCFETLARISVILLGLHYLGANGSTDVPTKKGTLSIWEFEKLANANKPDHLKKASECAFLAPVLDTSLRNGIGHNSARYDPATDEVVIYKQDGAALEESRILYTVFADRVLDVASWLLELNIVIFWILEANGGALQ